MQVAYCEKCGRRMMIRDPGAYAGKHLVCEKCGKEIAAAREAEGQHVDDPQPAAEPIVVGAKEQPTTARRPVSRMRPPSRVRIKAVRSEGKAQTLLRDYLMVICAGAFLVFLGLLAAYIMWGRGYGEPSLLSSQAAIAPAGGSRGDPPAGGNGGSLPAQPSQPAQAPSEPTEAEDGEVSTPAEPPEAPKAPKERKPIGGWGAAASRTPEAVEPSEVEGPAGAAEDEATPETATDSPLPPAVGGPRAPLAVTLRSYNGQAEVPTVEAADTRNSFRVGAKVVNDRHDTWKRVPEELSGGTRLLAARMDREQPPTDRKYVVNVSGPCTVYLALDQRYNAARLSWMDASWADSGLTCDSSSSAGWRIWKKDVGAAGDVALGCDTKMRDGVCYVFVGAPVSGEAVETALKPSDAAAAQTAAAESGTEPVEEVVGEPAGEVPGMPEKVAAMIAVAARRRGRYQVLSPAAALCRSYRFSKAIGRLEKHAEEDDLWKAVMEEMKRAGAVMGRLEEAVRGLQGKEIDVRLRGGRQSGTVRGYSSGMIMLQTAAGHPSALSLRSVPEDVLRRWLKGTRQEDLILFSIYSGRDFPEGADRGALSESARLMLGYSDWSAGEKKAAAALAKLRTLKEDGKWAELIAGSVDAARNYMDTYAVGVAARGELAAMLREALRKKKKTIVYQSGVTPSADYGGVTDTFISCYGKQYEVTSHMNQIARNFGKSQDLRMYSNSRRALIRFELEGLPEDVKLHKATMEIYCHKMNYETKGNLKAFLLAEEWVEGTGGVKPKTGATWEYRDGYEGKSWSTAGGTIVEQDFGLTEPGLAGKAEAEAGKWMVMDVTPGVDAWLAKKIPNYGFVLTYGKLKPDVWWVSSEMPDPANHPKLTLEYEGTVKGQEAVVPEDLQWLLHQEGATGDDAEVGGIEI